jgi:hypothetical protein
MVKSTNSDPKGKEKTDKPGQFAVGGKTKMFPQQSADPAEPGVSADATGRDKMDNTFGMKPGAGKGHMLKQSYAGPVSSGVASSGGKGGDTQFKVSGGKGHMAGYTGSTPAKPA